MSESKREISGSRTGSICSDNYDNLYRSHNQQIDKKGLKNPKKVLKNSKSIGKLEGSLQRQKKTKQDEQMYKYKTPLAGRIALEYTSPRKSKIDNLFLLILISW